MAEILPSLFFLNKKLHRKIKIVKSEDIAVAFCYPDEKHHQYFYSMVRREFQKAYSIARVSELTRRPVAEISKLLKNKLIDKPSGFEYHITSRRPKGLRWSQDDVLELRDRLYELAPKQKDGFPNSVFKLSSRAELLEAMNGDTSYYVRNEDGQFIRVWKAL